MTDNNLARTEQANEHPTFTRNGVTACLSCESIITDTDHTPAPLTEGRWETIRREVTDYLAASDFAEDFDQDGIVDAVGARANSIEDLPEDEFNKVLQAHDLTARGA